jgi:MYXO-CTERM domain-containing protein
MFVNALPFVPLIANQPDSSAKQPSAAASLKKPDPARPMKLKSTLPFSRQSMPLAAYLTGAVGSSFLVSAPQAEAAVTAVTFGFGSVLSTNSGYYNQNTSTTPNLGTIFAEGRIQPGFPPYIPDVSFVRFADFYHNRPGFGYGSASFLANGAIVGGGSNGPLGMAYFNSSMRPNLDITSDQLSQNLGFRTSTNNWGWANVSWNATAKELTFNSAYVESVAGNTITVGDVGAVPEPSRALLALAGFGAVALRRRRKQAA